MVKTEDNENYFEQIWVHISDEFKEFIKHREDANYAKPRDCYRNKLTWLSKY